MRVIKDADILSALKTIMLNNTKFNQSDFNFDCKIIKKIAFENEDKHFLCLTKNDGTWCFPERNVYMKNTDSYYTWQYYTDDKSVRAFAIDIKDNEKCLLGVMRGDIYEIDYVTQVTEMVKSHHHPDEITVNFENGESRTLNFLEYTNTLPSIMNKYGAVSSFHYYSWDEPNFEIMLDDVWRERRKTAKPISLDAYIKALQKEQEQQAAQDIENDFEDEREI